MKGASSTIPESSSSADVVNVFTELPARTEARSELDCCLAACRDVTLRKAATYSGTIGRASFARIKDGHHQHEH